MINKLGFVNICFLTVLGYCVIQCQVDFDASMMIHNVTAQKTVFTTKLISKARMLYDRYNPWKIPTKEVPVIPRIIHHVWFGKPVSSTDKQLRETWFAFHPEWKFILWTDRWCNDEYAYRVYSLQQLYNALNDPHITRIIVDVRILQFDNRTFFDQANNYGEKSDIIKYEIVYQFGGMYVDYDFECLKSFEPLFNRYDFFTGIQPFDTNIEQLGAALFAAKPNHPILHHAVETIKEDRHYVLIVVKTGPIHFSRSFIAVAGSQNNCDIAFPASFFYPCGYTQQGQDPAMWMQPESYAVHHWAGSWLKKDAFVTL